ncbi:alpha/beta hydrolase [Inquilinus sp. KBS0705]|nr:alpha/beta hydrolase [Inquilinus sp. KBS0705]
MRKIYLIAGLGADSRLFKNINLPGEEIVLTNWLIPDPDDTLTSYATKLIQQYHIQPGSVVIGVSLGGMLTVEIAKQVTLEKAILISSIKTDNEAPFYFRVFRKAPIYKFTPKGLFARLGFMIKPLFGKMEPDDQALFKDMLEKSSPVFIKWAMGAVLAWRNAVLIPNLYHIVGDKDLVFPIENIKNTTTVIKGGSHIMIFDKADEINRVLTGILSK